MPTFPFYCTSMEALAVPSYPLSTISMPSWKTTLPWYNGNSEAPANHTIKPLISAR